MTVEYRIHLLFSYHIGCLNNMKRFLYHIEKQNISKQVVLDPTKSFMIMKRLLGSCLGHCLSDCLNGCLFGYLGINSEVAQKVAQVFGQMVAEGVAQVITQAVAQAVAQVVSEAVTQAIALDYRNKKLLKTKTLVSHVK